MRRLAHFKKLSLIVFAGTLIFSVGLAGAFEFSLIDGAETLKKGSLLVGVAAGYKEAANSAQFTKVPSLLLGLGLPKKFDIRLNYYYLLLRHSPGFQHQSGSGDTVLALRHSLFDILGNKTGLQVKAKLPSANDQKGLGTKETDIYILALFSRKIENLTLDLNLGGAVLGDPRSGEDQDLFVAGMGVTYPMIKTVLLQAEFSANGDPTDIRLAAYKRFNNHDILKAGLGLRFPVFYGFRGIFFMRAGLNEYSPNYEFSLGFCRTFNIPGF
jgi:hypothetical protein